MFPTSCWVYCSCGIGLFAGVPSRAVYSVSIRGAITVAEKPFGFGFAVAVRLSGNTLPNLDDLARAAAPEKQKHGAC